MIKRHKGIAIITLTAILLIAGLCILPLVRAEAADNWNAGTFRLPFMGESNKVIVLRDYATGYIINATTGASAVTTALADGELTGVQDSITNDWEFAIPSIAKTIKTAYFTVYNVAATSVDKTTTPSDSRAYLLDIKDKFTYSSSVPWTDGVTFAQPRN